MMALCPLPSRSSVRSYGASPARIVSILWICGVAICNGFTIRNNDAVTRIPSKFQRGREAIGSDSLLRGRRRLWQLSLYQDEEEDDDSEPPDVDISNFRSPATVGWNAGRSPPNARKAMGRSSASTTSVHVCSNCGSEFVKHFGRCPTCKEWNTLQEHTITRATNSGPSRPMFHRSSSGGGGGRGSWVAGDGDDGSYVKPIRLVELNKQQQSNSYTGSRRIVLQDDRELNTVLGGGLMKGSLILLGGDPGVGKVAASIAREATPIPGVGMGLPANQNQDAGTVWYVSGEETPEQIASRASRLGLDSPELFLLQETHIDSLCQQVVDYQARATSPSSEDEQQKQHPLALLVVDSIQTMVCDAGGFGATGGVSQVRESMALLLRLAKTTKVPVVVIGHVTKSGDVAGPRTVEHMVDTVLYLEGDSSSNIRMLRASKNRFGASDEVGVYEMTAGRLLPVTDPSSLFLSMRDEHSDQEGCAIAVLLEGMRAIAVEIQALVAIASGDNGRKTVNGIPFTRLSLLMGVLQKHCGISFGRRDVYVNVAGKFRLEQGHTADLAVAIALASSASCIPIRGDTVFVGEVGLLGELRSVPAIDKRIQEARRMGFSRAIAPSLGRKRKEKQVTNAQGLTIIYCGSLKDALDEGLVNPISSFKKKRRETKSRGQSAPETIADLGLDDTIMDDGEDENIFL